MMKPNRPCELGKSVGENMSKLADQAEEDCREKLGFVAIKCSTCAFKSGSIPNGCLTTVADAMKCTMENEPFFCHHKIEDGKPTTLCAGWLMMDRSNKVEAPWEFTS